MPHRSSIRATVLTVCLAVASISRSASAQCDHLTRGIAQHISAVASASAPAWARSLITATQLVRFDAANYHGMTYFLGYSEVTLERLGVGGVPPYSATVVVRCRDLHAEVVSDPFTWANARAHELHPVIDTAQKAVEYVTEVMMLLRHRRPDSASATRHGAIYRVDLSLAPQQGDPSGAPQSMSIEVTHDGSVQPSAPGAAP